LRLGWYDWLAMDVEKTIEFLLQNQAVHDERLTRIENAVVVLIDKTNRLDDVMATLAEAHIKSIEQMDVMAKQSMERDDRLGARIDSLVTAIGEFIRNRPSN